MIDYNHLLNQVGVKLQLPENKYNELKKNYNALTEYIDNNHILSDSNGEMYVQGSFAIDTAILPLKGNDVDVDMVTRFDTLWIPGMQVQPFYDKLYDVFKEGRYSNLVEEHKSVIRINYSNDYHFDIMPVLKKDNEKDYKRIKGVHIDENQKKWVDRAPKLYKEWYDNKAIANLSYKPFYLLDNKLNLRDMAVENLPQPNYYEDKPPLTRAIQFIKRARDKFFFGVCDYVPQSIVLTTMISNLYEGEHKIDELLKKICINFYDLAAKKEEFVVYNPVNATEEFTEKWKNEKNYYTNFFKFAYWFYYKVLNLLSTDNKNHFKRHLEDLLGTTTTNQLINNEIYLGSFWNNYYWKNNKYLVQDQLIEDMYELDLRFPVQISNEIISKENTYNRNHRRYLSRIYKNSFILHNYSLKFTVDLSSVTGLYNIFWKVRNIVENPSNYNQIRGKIEIGSVEKTENSSFNGNHFVECYIVQKNKVVAMDRIEVPIRN
jgi:hypothetical protein